ncbi:MAG TPA: inorganic pyrophosphatase [Chitinophagales bacterium]|nr:inorganic pyrophosphatase [Chitinophagales bacterium]
MKCPPYKAHPWHGISFGEQFPDVLTAFIEIVPADTVKYEIDKASGWLKVDRPQLFSNVVPALYGFIPQTLCDIEVGKYCMAKTGKQNIAGDQDPMDILVLEEKNIQNGGILIQAIPIGGFRMIDKNEADDKIIAVMKGDAVYGNIKDISELSESIVNRLKHYFLTYKDLPGTGEEKRVEIAAVYGREEALEVIKQSAIDYKNRFAE